MGRRSRIERALAVVLAVACLGGGAGAEPSREPSYAELKSSYESAQKAKEWDKVQELLPRLVAAAKAGGVEDEVKDCIQVLNRHLTYGSEALQIVSLAGFGTLARPTSSQYLRSFVDGDRAGKRSLKVRKAAMEAWARIHDPGTHEVLLGYFVASSADPVDRDLAAWAVTQYRHYKGVAKKHRFVVLRDFMQAYQRVYDDATLLVSASAQGWWGLMNGPMLSAWNHLNDTKLGTFEQCAAWWRANKQKIQADRD